MNLSFTKSVDERTEDLYAYKIAFMYFIANSVSAMMSTTLSPLSKTLSLGYNVSELSILYLNSVFNLYFLFFNFPANYCIEKFGVKPTLNCALILTIIGAVFRIGIDINVGFVYLGQTLMAIAGPFITNLLTRISNKWFLAANRTKMTSLMASSYMFGLGFGFLLSSLALTEKPEIEIRKTEIFTLMVTSSLVCTITLIPVIIFFKEEPLIAPSMSALSNREEFGQSLLSLLSNKDYLLLGIIFSVGLSNFISMISMIHHVLAPFNYSEYQISNIGIIINFASGISKVFIAFVVNNQASFKKTIAVIFTCLSVCTLLFTYTLSGGKIMFVYFMAFLFGFFCQMYWGPALEYANEVVFPVSEAQATGTLIFGGCIFSVISNYIISSLYNHKVGKEDYLIYLFISYIFCIILTNYISDKLKREEYESFNIYGVGQSYVPMPLINVLNQSNSKNKSGKKYYL